MARKDAKNAASRAAEVEARAGQSANARIAQRRTALKRNSLLSDEQGASGMAASQRGSLGGV